MGQYKPIWKYIVFIGLVSVAIVTLWSTQKTGNTTVFYQKYPALLPLHNLHGSYVRLIKGHGKIPGAPSEAPEPTLSVLEILNGTTDPHSVTFPLPIDPSLIRALVTSRLSSIIELRLAKAKLYRKRLEAEFSFPPYRNETHVNSTNIFVTSRPPDGGLGNFMFEFASLLGIARKNHRLPVIQRPEYRMTLFEGMNLEFVNVTILYPNGTPHMDQCTLYNLGAGKFTSSMHNLSGQANTANCTAAIGGYVQSWKYFDHVRDEIRAMFTFKKHIFDKAHQIIEKGLLDLQTAGVLQPSRTLAILAGIHVRRGDILQDPHKSGGQVPATEEYLLRIALHVQRKYENVVFIVLSNDMVYCRKLFVEPNFIFVTDGSSTEVDMAIMTLCDVMIMSVGSYGWWGSYLGDAKEVFYYRDWPRNGSSFANELNHHDYFLPQWQART